jgi:hypothetical protein
VGKTKEEIKSYFRFYPSPSRFVLFIQSTGNPLEVARWFHYANQNLGIGKYKITGTDISFKIKFDSLIDNYQGKIIANGLLIEHLKPNQKSKSKIYQFFQIPDIDYYYIETLEQKIKENQGLEKFDEVSDYVEYFYTKYMEQIMKICEKYSNETAKAVLKILTERNDNRINKLKIL